jgi:hypothetical protein
MQYPLQQPPPQFQPPSGYYPPQVPYTPPKKSHKGLWITLAVIAVVVIASCTIFSSAMNSVSKTAATTSASAVTQDTGSSSTSSSSGNTVVNLGQTITVNDVSGTATSAQKLQADSFNIPKQGNEFIVVHVKLVNNGQSDQNYNTFDFHAKSGAGNVTDVEFGTPSSYTKNSILDSGKLAPGGKVEGDMIFQIPIGDSKAELTWTPSFFNTSSQYAWKLSVK